MKFKRPSSDDETEHPDSLYETDRSSDRPGDERQLYGEPRHEVGSEYDEQTLYGEPQHETRESPELPDLELLFARMRAESASGPAVFPSDSSTATTTER